MHGRRVRMQVSYPSQRTIFGESSLTFADSLYGSERLSLPPLPRIAPISARTLSPRNETGKKTVVSTEKSAAKEPSLIATWDLNGGRG